MWVRDRLEARIWPLRPTMRALGHLARVQVLAIVEFCPRSKSPNKPRNLHKHCVSATTITALARHARGASWSVHHHEPHAHRSKLPRRVGQYRRPRSVVRRPQDHRPPRAIKGGFGYRGRIKSRSIAIIVCLISLPFLQAAMRSFSADTAIRALGAQETSKDGPSMKSTSK